MISGAGIGRSIDYVVLFLVTADMVIKADGRQYGRADRLAPSAA
jgi:hypothetical protein